MKGRDTGDVPSVLQQILKPDLLIMTLVVTFSPGCKNPSRSLKGRQVEKSQFNTIHQPFGSKYWEDNVENTVFLMEIMNKKDINEESD